MSDTSSGTVPSLEACLAAATDTKAMSLREGALEDLGDILGRFFPGEAVFLVADENTMAAAGNRVGAVIRESGIAIEGLHVFPGVPRLHADYRHVRELVAAMGRGRTGGVVPVAVGAGTVNDIVKRAAGELGLPYLCAPTAASVDGYTSYGAALLSDGYKRTMECPAPRVVVADTSVLAGAPGYLSSSGFGDLASKIVAGTDWIVAEAAGRGGAPGTEPIDTLAWDMTQTGLADALERSVAAAKGDPDAVGALFRALALTGFSMQHLRSSRPVSGCEHLFSHVWEMADLSVDGVPVTHGHKVAIGTLAATALTEAVFSRAEPPAAARIPTRSAAEREGEARAAFAGLGAVDSVVDTVTAKLLGAEARKRLASALSDEWGRLRNDVLDRLVPYAQLRALLDRAGCPIRPEDIGLSRRAAIETARSAQMIRNRYTVLDMAWDLGILEEALADIERDARYLR